MQQIKFFLTARSGGEWSEEEGLLVGEEEKCGVPPIDFQEFTFSERG